MGIGISGNRLAGSVAAAGGVGTLSSVDLRRHHPDLMDRTRELAPGEEAKAGINAANLEAIDREIKAARERTGGKGLLAINVMRAVSEYAANVTRALEAGIDAVVVGTDRVAANGDVANKIGTYQLAVNAMHHGVRFMVVAPSSTIDMSLESGDEIPIEERDGGELLELAGQRIAAAVAMVGGIKHVPASRGMRFPPACAASAARRGPARRRRARDLRGC